MRPVIVCGLDGSPCTGELVRIAARLAEVLDADLHLVHVLGAQSALPSLASAEAHDSEREALTALDALCRAAGAPDAKRSVIRYGDPARRLAITAEQSHAMLLVVGSRGDQRGGDRLLGSVSSRLAADAPCPVLVIAPGSEAHIRPEEWRGRTLVTGQDGSDAGWRAAREATRLAERLGGGLIAVTVGPDAQLLDDEVAALVPTGDVRHERRHGDPAWELEAVAAAMTAPLIAVGSRGLGPWRDPLLGSVVRDLLKTARRPVLILPAASLLAAAV